MADSEPIARLPGCLRMSHQPVMISGLTGSEFIATLGIGFTVALVTVAVVGTMLGALHFGMLAGGVGGVAAGLSVRSAIRSAKRQRPDGYPMQWVLRLRQDVEPMRDLLAHEGSWDPLRHRGSSS